MRFESYNQRSRLIRKIIFWSIIIGGILALFIPTLVRAETPTQPVDPCQIGLFCVRGIGDNTAYTEGDPAQRISNIIRDVATILAYIGASIALIFVIKSAWDIMNSGGDSAKYQKAVMGLIYAVIGLVIIAASFAIIQVVVNIIVGFQV